MLVLILGLVVFLGGHSTLIIAPGLRDGTTRYGENAWRAGYSVVAVLGIVLIVVGYGMARSDPVVVWQPPVWTRHLALLLMLPVFVFIAATYLPGRIKTTLRHPMLAGVKLWALAHLLANGTLADIVLFGSFLGWAVADRVSLKYRKQAVPAPAAAPFRNDLLAVVVGLAVYLLFVLYLHRALFGVAPV